MAWLRAKTCVWLLFALITFGQAYPYSYAWAESRQAECGCNDSGRKCIHGCDLKNRPKPAPQAHRHGAHDSQDHHPDHAALGHDHAHHHHGSDSEEPPAFVSEEDETRPLWVSPDCSKQKKREILDFRGDPFFPEVLTFFYPRHALSLAGEPFPQAVQRAFFPEPPPPKSSSLS